MDTKNNQFPWLEFITGPAFCVKDGIIVATNSGANQRMIPVGIQIAELLGEHKSVYESTDSGCLYLTVLIGNIPCTAGVTKTQDYDLFTLCDNEEPLRAFALAAEQLRIPLSNVMSVTDRLLTDLDTANPEISQQASQINRGLFQLLRIVSNMSDTGIYQEASTLRGETVDFTGFFEEIMEKAQTACSGTSIRLEYQGPRTSVFGYAYPERLERAVYNLISNAVKFSPKDSTIEASLTKKGETLVFTIVNPSTASNNEGLFWNRYCREPAIEDSRSGLGLGMSLIGGAATAHGGTVLIDHPTNEQTRVTMTIPIKKADSTDVHSPKITIGDYAGGRDKSLLEFSEFLPTDHYKDIN